MAQCHLAQALTATMLIRARASEFDRRDAMAYPTSAHWAKVYLSVR